MSSNQRLKKVCQFCKTIFVAQKTSTKYCSLKCAQKNYKEKKRGERKAKNIEATRTDMGELLAPTNATSKGQASIVKELIGVKELSAVTSLSVRTIYRLMNDKEFPRIKVGKRLLFKKDEVVNYLINKFQAV